MANLQTLALLLDPKLRFAEAETLHDLLTPTERARSGVQKKRKRGAKQTGFGEWLALYDDMLEEEIRQTNLGLYSYGSLFIFGPEPEAEASNYVPRTFRGRIIWLLQRGSTLTKGDRHDGAYLDRAILAATVLSCIVHVSLSDRICEIRLESVEAGFGSSWDSNDGILKTFYPFAKCSTDETRRRLVANLIFDFLFTALITVEAIMKIIAKGFVLHPKSYLREGWCAFELGVVILGWLQFFPGQQSQAYARVGRLLRPLQFLPRFYGMRKMVENLIPSIRPAGMALFLSGTMMLVLALIGMEIFHGDLRSRCVDAGRSISVAVDASDYSHICSPHGGFFGGTQCPVSQVCTPYRTASCANRSSIDPACFYPNPGALFHFDDILSSLMTLGKAVISDDWSRTMRLLQNADSHLGALLYFATVVFLLSWFMVHLIVAVIRDVYLKSLQLDKIRSTSSRQFESVESGMERTNRIIELMTRLFGNLFEIFSTMIKVDRLKSQIVLWWHEQRGVRRRFRRMRRVLRNFVELKAFDYSILMVVVVNIFVMCFPYFSYQEYQDNVCLALSQKLYGLPLCTGPLVNWNRTSMSVGNGTLFKHSSGFCRMSNDTEKACFTSWREVEQKNLTYDSVCQGEACLGISSSLNTNLDNLNIIFTMIFTIELGMKLFALGPFEYCRSLSNLFDAFIVLTSLIEVGNTSGSGSTGTTTLRAFRVFRVGRLLRRWPAMRIIMAVVKRVGQQIIALTILLFIFTFIAAQAGSDMLGGKLHNAVEGKYCQTCQDKKYAAGNGTCSPRSCVLQIPRTNFDSFFPGSAGYGAFISIITMITKEKWSLLAEISYAAGGGIVAVIYFILIEFFGAFLIFNLFLVVLVHAYVEIAREMREARAAKKKGISMKSWDIFLISVVAKIISLILTIARNVRDVMLSLWRFLMRRLKKSPGIQSNEALNPVAIPDQSQPAPQTEPDPSELFASPSIARANHAESALIADAILRGITDLSLFIDERIRMIQAVLLKIPLFCAVLQRYKAFQQYLSTMVMTKQFDNVVAVAIVMSTIVLLAEDPLLLLSECCPGNFQLVQNSTFFKGNRSCVRGLALPADMCSGHGTCLSTGICACERDPIWYTAEQCQCNWFSSSTCRSDWVLVRHSTGYHIFLVLEYTFALIFGLEMVLKIICCGLYFPSSVIDPEGRNLTPYLKDPWNVFDGVMVLVTLYAAFAGDDASKGVRGFRGIRCLRPLRMLKRFPALRMIVLYIMKSTPQVAKMSLVFLALVGIFAVIGLQLFSGGFYACRNPINYPSLPLTAAQAAQVTDLFECLKQGGIWAPPVFTFDSIFEAIILLLIAAGDHWVGFMDAVADINDVGKNPRTMLSPFSSWYFVLYAFFAQFCLLHAFLAVAMEEYLQLKEGAGLGFLTRKQVNWIRAEKLKMASMKINNVREWTEQQQRDQQLSAIANIVEDDHEEVAEDQSEAVDENVIQDIDHPNSILETSDTQSVKTDDDLRKQSFSGGFVPTECESSVSRLEDLAVSDSDRSVRGSATLFGNPHDLDNANLSTVASEKKGESDTRAKDWYLMRIQAVLLERITLFSAFCFNVVSHSFFEYSVDAVVVVELALMTLNSFPPNPFLDTGTPFIDLTFATLFVSEMMVKIFALGWRTYVSDRLNRFDAVCSTLTFSISVVRVAIAVSGHYSEIPGLTMLRALRIFRVFRLFRKEPTLLGSYYTLVISLPGVLRLFAMMLLLWAVYLAVGMPMFYNVRWASDFKMYVDSNTNFVNLLHSITTLLSIASGNGWVQLMESSSTDKKDYGCQWDLNWDGNFEDEDGCGGRAAALFYYPSFAFFQNLLVNIVLVFIIDNFGIASDLTIESAMADEAIREFMTSWRRYDPEKTFLIESRRLRDLLLDMPPPFGFRGQRTMKSCAAFARQISPYLKSVVMHDPITNDGKERRRLTMGSVVYACFKVAFPLSILPSAGVIVAAAKAAYEAEDETGEIKPGVDLLKDVELQTPEERQNQAARVLQFSFSVFVKGSRILRGVRRMLRQKAALYKGAKVKRRAIGALISEIIYDYWKKYVHPKPHFAIAEYWGRLSVTLVAGKDLPSTGRAGKCDPFAHLSCCGVTNKSVVMVDTYNPIWEELFIFDCNDTRATLDVQVYDDDVVKKVLLGEVRVPISTVWLQPDMMLQKWFKMQGAVSTSEQDSHIYLDIRARTYKWVINIAVLGCRKLPIANIDEDTVMNPYATLILGDRTFMTLPKNGTFDPSFNEHFTFFVHDLQDEIRLVVCNNQPGDENGDGFVGQVRIPLTSMLSLRNLYAFPFSGRRLPGIWTGDRWYSLQAEDDRQPNAQAYVFIIEGKDLPKMDAFGKIDCFCFVRLVKKDGKLNRAQKTPVQYSTFTPKWNQQFVFDLYDHESHLLVEVYDSNMDGTNVFVGIVKLEMSQFRANGEIVDAWYDVEHVEGRSPPVAGSLGKIRFSVEIRTYDADYAGSFGYVHLNFEARLIARIPPIREFLIANRALGDPCDVANEQPADMIDAYLKLSIIEGKGFALKPDRGFYCSFDVLGTDTTFLGATKIVSGQKNPRWCEDFVAKTIEFSSYISIRVWSLNISRLIDSDSSDFSDPDDMSDKKQDDLVGFIEVSVFELWSSMQTATEASNNGAVSEDWQADMWLPLVPSAQGRPAEDECALRLIFSFAQVEAGHEYDQEDEFATRGILRTILVNKVVNDQAAAERGVQEMSKAAQHKTKRSLLSRLRRRRPRRVTPASAPTDLSDSDHVVFQRPLQALEAAGVTGVALDTVRAPRSTVPQEAGQEIDPLRYLEQTGRVLPTVQEEDEARVYTGGEVQQIAL